MKKKYGKERAMRKEEIVEISAFLAPKSAPNGKEKTKMLEEIVSSVYLNRKALKDGILSCYVNSSRFAVITLDLNKYSKKLRKKFKLDSLLDGTFRI